MPIESRPLNQAFSLPFHQADVDFVIPDLTVDRRLAIDPFLLYKSRNPEYAANHDKLISVFNEAIARFAKGDEEGAAALVNFPEVDEIGFGYTAGGIKGSGLGDFLNRLLLRTLGESPELVKRGVRHVEEMQLVALGIGPDRVSDIAANILKQFLIEYTQEQAHLWKIPITKDVPVHNLFDFGSWSWKDDYYDLPLNLESPTPRPILLVPRRIVRQLPWINFDDYQRMEFALFLSAQRVRGSLRPSRRGQKAPSKPEIVAITRREVERIDRYVDAKEKTANQAQPAELLVESQICSDSEALINKLKNLPSGIDHYISYQDLILRIFNLLFEPDLIEGRPQVRSEAGTEIRDLIYTNDSDKPFWDFIRNHHANLSLVLELKNKVSLETSDVDQLAGYLGDALGYLGLLVVRSPWGIARRRKAISWYNKGNPHRVILCLSDDDVIRMLQMKCAGKDPTAVIRQAYQDFMAKIQ